MTSAIPFSATYADHRGARHGRRRGHAGADLQRPQRLMHNQRALYIKRLLLFEPRVILTTVPYRLS